MARRRHPVGADDSVDILVPRSKGRLCEVPERDFRRNSGIYPPRYEKSCPTIGQRDGHAQAHGPEAQNLAQLCHATRILGTPAPAFTLARGA
jgi:hypothetical protein